MLFSRTTTDYDITTSATPAEIRAVFTSEKLFEYGEKHGTIGFMRSGLKIEITTFRREGEYSDGRRPDNVKFITDLDEDLLRRDFTINAIAVNRKGDIFDPFNGIDDFEAKLIRSVGDPIERFREDSLRMLRGIRFAVRFGFEIEKQTLQSIRQSAHIIKLHQISTERILSELKEIFSYPFEGLNLLIESNLLYIVIPEITKHMGIQLVAKFVNHPRINYIITWAILLDEILSMRDHELQTNNRLKSDIQNFFKKFPGTSNREIQSIYGLVRFNEEFILIHLLKSRRDQFRSLRSILNEFKSWPDFKFEDFFKHLLSTNEILSTTKLQSQDKIDLLELTTTYSVLYFQKIVVSGVDAQELGFTGSEIQRILELWREEYVLNPSITRADLISLAK